MTTMRPAVHGSGAHASKLAVRDVGIVAQQTSAALEPGKSVDLKFAAVNQSPDVNDQLVGITSEIGTVSVSGDTTIPASGTLVVGTPEGPDATAMSSLEGPSRAGASVALTKPISNGLTYSFTFPFA